MPDGQRRREGERHGIQVKNIWINRAEGFSDECGIDHIVSDFNEADAMLAQMSQSAPDDFGYNKVDFRITFEDDNTYEGTYDLKHYSVELPDLEGHVARELNFYAGNYCPDHMTVEQYRDFLTSLDGNMDIQKRMLRFLDDYEITNYSRIS